MVTNENTDIIGFGLTEEQQKQIMDAGAMGWSPDDIAVCYGYDRIQFIIEYNSPDSSIAVLIRQGCLRQMADEEKALLESTSKGDIPSIQELTQRRRERGFELTKLDIFGGFENQESFDRIQDYIANGSIGKLSPHDKLYLDLLQIINTFDNQFGKRATIQFLVKEYRLKYAQAVDYYDESIAFFYSERNNTKESLRHKYAEMLDSLAIAARKVATNVKDYSVVGDLVMKAYKIRGLDQPDIEKLPAEAYQRQIRVFTLSLENMGLPPVNRQELAQQIDALEIPEADKKRLRRDAMITDVPFEEVIGSGIQG